MLWQIWRPARFGWLNSPELGRCAFRRQAGKRRLYRARLKLRERNLRRYLKRYLNRRLSGHLKRRPMLRPKGHINTIRSHRQHKRTGGINQLPCHRATQVRSRCSASPLPTSGGGIRSRRSLLPHRSLPQPAPPRRRNCQRHRVNLASPANPGGATRRQSSESLRSLAVSSPLPVSRSSSRSQSNPA